MKLYLLRHGQTDWNAALRLQGRTDIPLNEKGREMAIACGKALADQPFDLCITSTLDRAVETASLILAQNHCDLPETEPELWPGGTVTDKYGFRLFKDPRLMEYCFGEWEGRFFKGPGYDLPVKEYGDYWESMNDDVIYPGMEGKAALVGRVRSFLDELTDRYKNTDRNILAVAHGGVMRAVKMIADDDTWTFRIKVPGNCEALVLEPDPDAAKAQAARGILPGSLKYGRRMKILR